MAAPALRATADVITISTLTPGHRRAWQELFTGYNAFYNRLAPAEAYDRTWAEFQADSRMHALGASMDGRLVGIAHFLQHASTTAPDVCYLQDLFTAPDVRGHGIGRALVAAVTDWARERGCSRVYWMTHETNATARRLYDAVAGHHGFIRYEIEL